ncbi:MAG TPA: recombination regulator RecX [Azospira sp.]|nr:recombination regulator RecX [Azospira sp.]
MNDLRQRALRLLARREHARTELKKKLAPHAESEAALEALLDELAARRLLSDARYAEMRVSSRGGRFGNARLAQELKSQGVADGVVGEALAGAGDELARAYAIWRRKFGTLPADAAERARQTRYLLYRGFSGDVIRRILRGEGNEQEEE